MLRSFGLEECEGAPHDARIVRRSALVGALRSAIPPELISYGISVADVHAHEQGPPSAHGAHPPCTMASGLPLAADCMGVLLPDCSDNAVMLHP